ncbi:MAG TPA: hypothetical protein VLX91_01075 [Candidatus Acidoferrales bacterium]|nr:hypothetical protein [Candidatus Acidoferrales bacterium]
MNFLFIVCAIMYLCLYVPNANAQFLKRTYKLADTTSTQPSSNTVSQILISNGRVFLATNKGLNVATTGGMSFQTNLENGPTGISADAVAIQGDTIAVAVSTTMDQGGTTYLVGQGLFASTDNGTTWTKEPQSVDSQADTTVVFGNDTLRALPVTTNVQNITFSLVFHKGYLYTANWAGGLRRSNDLGKTWQRVVLPPDNLSYINQDSTYNFQLSVLAGKITDETNYNQYGFSLYSDGDSVLYVGTAGGIDKTADNGYSWQKFSHQNESSSISGDFVVSLAGQNSRSIHRIWGATVVANDPTETSALSYTDDGGATWHSIWNGHFFHGMASKDSTVVYGVSDDGLFRTSDLGSSSQVITNIYDQTTKQSISHPSSDLSQAFYAVATSGDTVWVGSGDGSAVGIDNGAGFDASEWHVLRAYATVAANSTYFYPNPFSPHLDVGRIHYYIGNGGRVTIRILDFSMHIVRTLLQNATRTPIDSKGNADELWNGASDRGGFVDNGVYFYSVVVNGGTPSWGKILVLR